MASLISCATGNFTTSTTWALVDATSVLDTDAASAILTTSYQYSSTFTPGALTIDGVAVKIANVATSPTGTITLELFNNTGTVSITSVTINVSDIFNTTAGAYQRGWYFFKFSAPQLLVIATDYKIGLKTSSASQVTPYSSATTNWSRMLRTTTTQAPASGDALHVIGEWTAAATLTSFTVTMENTATTSFGPTASTVPQGITIGKGGTMTFGTSASTNYYLKWKGVLGVAGGGTLNVGTSGTQMPSTSTAVLEMDSATNVDSGIAVFEGGALNIWGATKTNKWSLMTADKAVAATVIALVDTTGWAASDELCFASTTQTNTQCEKKTITTVDSSTQVTISAGLTNAHSGTSPTQAEVGNLTRNVKIRGIGTNAPSTSTTLQGYIVIAATASVTFRYAEFYYLGSSSIGKRGLDIATTTGTFDMQYCSIHDGWITSSRGSSISSASGSGITFSNNVCFNINSEHIINVATAGVQVFDANILMLSVATSIATLADAGTTFTNTVIAGSITYGLTIAEAAALGTISGNTIHSGGNANGSGLGLSNIIGGTLGSLISYRNSSVGGLRIIQTVQNVTFNSLTLFGNANRNIYLNSGGAGIPSLVNCIFNDLISSGDTTFATTSGVETSASASSLGARFNSSDFSTVSGIKAAHTNDILVGLASTYASVLAYNSKFGGTNVIGSQSNLATYSFFGVQRLGTTAGNHKTFMAEGTAILDTTLFKTASPSCRLTPISASLKLASGIPGYGFIKKVDNGGTATASIYVRKSKTSTGDAATYNGNHPRLIVRRNNALGITTDTVLATATTASEGAWELLSGTTGTVTDDGACEFFVDIDGTVGFVNIDDFS